MNWPQLLQLFNIYLIIGVKSNFLQFSYTASLSTLCTGFKLSLVAIYLCVHCCAISSVTLEIFGKQLVLSILNIRYLQCSQMKSETAQSSKAGKNKTNFVHCFMFVGFARTYNLV